jgi:hypothetical protein
MGSRWWLVILGRRSHATNPITSGRTYNERVDSVASFTGSAFRVDGNTNAQRLLVLGADVVSIMLRVAWEWDSETPRVLVEWYYQGVAMRAGEDRVAVFGEIAMFTAQLAGSERMPRGTNSPVAPENREFLLNVSHWLSGLVDPDTKTTNSPFVPVEFSALAMARRY